MFKNCTVIAISAVSTLVGTTVTSAQGFPNKPIRIVSSEVGGGVDILARMIAQGLSANVGQPVVVENRGGGVLVRAQLVMRAPPDGYTLQFGGASQWLLPFMRDDVPYDPLKDFTPITLVATQPNAIIVHPSLPVRSVKELIDMAKARPGALNCATGAPGALSHLAPELFKQMTGVKMTGVPYKGTGPALNGLMGGETQLMFPTLVQAIPYIKSEKLRGLAVTSTSPASAFPSLPTVAATVPGYESGAKYAMFAPAKMPRALVTRVNQELVRVINSAEVKEKLAKAGAESVGSSPEELVKAIRAEMASLGKLIKDAGIRAE